ncbi:MAG TPA: glycosyltransferase family 2 protein [Isosphaeraceae bacterium]|nr:glycosyltransferase family 2 protein [Isosphaeraceae bacterium]
MSWPAILFWLSAACVLYTYVGYPLVLALAARLRPTRRLGAVSRPDVPVSVVVAAYNEAARIRARIDELVQLVADRSAGGEVIVVSDGSTDGTAERALAAASESESAAAAGVLVRAIVQEPRQGKAMALNLAHAAARHPILILADVRQTWAPDALDWLTAPFADPAVGAVSGDLAVESAPGVMEGVGLYWRFEKWLRRTESRFDSMVSVTGCIAAVRRELFTTLPAGTILDDVYWPLAVAMGGHRVVHEERARAFDRLPEKPRDEFRRKVRTLAGNFQLMARMPAALLPWRNRLWWQFVSHRALRLLVPWALLVMVATSAVAGGAFYQAAFYGQLAFYGFGIAGAFPSVSTRSRLASAIASFLVLNAAAWIAFWVWACGRSTRSWARVEYVVPVPRQPANT